MKLYDVTAAPNPRRVRIFLAEKGMQVDLVQVDMAAGEHKSPAFLAMNPSGKVPVLETDAGEHIAESVAICRYLEALQNEPNLFGATPVELGRIEMHNRILEFELWSQIGISWVNGPVVAQMAPGRFRQNPQAKEASDAAVQRFYKRLDRELGGRPYAAGARYSIADITALTAVDFAASRVGLKPEAGLANLWAWHERVSARPSASA
ncbi:MAG: glutathione S-transferase family protein [Pseudomonadales bacterium]